MVIDKLYNKLRGAILRATWIELVRHTDNSYLVNSCRRHPVGREEMKVEEKSLRKYTL
jgi:hypothetical protein